MNVDRKGNDGTDERAKLEDGPKDSERLALVLFEWITEHNRALGGPKQRRSEAEHATGKNNEPSRSLRLETSSRALNARMRMEPVDLLRLTTTRSQYTTNNPVSQWQGSGGARALYMWQWIRKRDSDDNCP